MTPLDALASQGPIHATAAFLRARLAQVFPAARFHHELLAAPLTPQTVGRLANVRAPFVGLAFLGLRPMAQTGRALQATQRWGLYLLTRAPAAPGRLLGDTQAPGLAQMVHAAILGLHGWTVAGERDAGAGTIAMGDGEAADAALWNDQHGALWSTSLDVASTFTAPSPDALQRLAQEWTFATDTMTLEGR